jgi:putative transposase
MTGQKRSRFSGSCGRFANRPQRLEMKSNLELPSRRSIRLPNYDYSQNGCYFVTICVKDRECLLGDVEAGVMRVNQAGSIAGDRLQWLADRYPFVDLDEWIVMPNHIHAIVLIEHLQQSVALERAVREPPLPKTKPLGRLIGAFKTVSCKAINQIRGMPQGIVWQRNYYEHIIRGERDLSRIREYIRRNPLAWASDPENPGSKTNTSPYDWQV